MKNSDTVWSKIEGGETKIQKILKVSNQKNLVEYVILKTQYLERDHYKILISLPFNCESNWGITDYSKSSSWEERAVSIIESTLRSRYNQIKLRNCKQFRLHTFLKKNNIEIRELFHFPLHEYDKIKKVFIGDIFSEYEKLSAELKTLKISKCEERKDLLMEKTFNKLLLNGKCEYCGITIKEINQLSDDQKLYTKRARGYSMEIDQKDSNGLYTDDNCVASCYWCNNAKTDEFTFTEFKKVAEGINEMWKSRLGNNSVRFPKETWD